jgi:hypothetical protein
MIAIEKAVFFVTMLSLYLKRNRRLVSGAWAKWFWERLDHYA